MAGSINKARRGMRPDVGKGSNPSARVAGSQASSGSMGPNRTTMGKARSTSTYKK